jgi:type IV fimbrial biogenesis protein FimT
LWFNSHIFVKSCAIFKSDLYLTTVFKTEAGISETTIWSKDKISGKLECHTNPSYACHNQAYFMKSIRHEKTSGFTLIELMVTIGIAGILVGVAIPGFNSIISNSRLTTSTNELVTALNLARSEAVKRGLSVTVRKVDDNSSTHLGDTANWSGANWENGWDVFTDADSDGNFETGDILIKTFTALPSSYSLRGNNNFTNFVRYTPNGFLSNVGGGSFVICNGLNVAKSRLIIIKGTGRIRIATDADHNGIPEKEDGTEISSCTSGF